jgi:uncharacterized HhH-GPD family protein
MSAGPTFPVTEDPAANELLVKDPLALLLGMLLDQQVPMEWAFHSPYRLAERLGTDRLDARAIAELPPDEIEKLFKGPPALHRFPGAMGKRAQAVCQYLVENYGGDAAALWRNPESGAALVKKVEDLPGFGKEKARIFCALLAKRFGVTPEGWEEATHPFSDDQPRSVADIDSREAFAQVRAWKQAKRAQGKGKAD